jgi:hypothetical protein
MFSQALIGDDDVHADLDEIVARKEAGRENSEERTFFSYVGMAPGDLAIASVPTCEGANNRSDTSSRTASLVDLAPVNALSPNCRPISSIQLQFALLSNPDSLHKRFSLEWDLLSR